MPHTRHIIFARIILNLYIVPYFLQHTHTHTHAMTPTNLFVVTSFYIFVYIYIGVIFTYISSHDDSMGVVDGIAIFARWRYILRRIIELDYTRHDVLLLRVIIIEVRLSLETLFNAGSIIAIHERGGIYLLYGILSLLLCPAWGNW